MGENENVKVRIRKGITAITFDRHTFGIEFYSKEKEHRFEGVVEAHKHRHSNGWTVNGLAYGNKEFRILFEVVK